VEGILLSFTSENKKVKMGYQAYSKEEVGNTRIQQEEDD